MKIGIVSSLAVLFLHAAASGAGPTVIAVTNGASLTSGPIAPGELIRISGTGFATSSAQSAGTVPLPTSLAGVSVMIDGNAIGLVGVSATQIQAAVPAQLQPGSHQLVAMSGSGSSLPFQVTGAADSPGIFTADSSGQGQALAFNSDGTPNSTANPAIPGTNVTVYFTGAGQTNPPFTDSVLPTSANFVAIDSEGLGPSHPFATWISGGLVPNRAGYDQVTLKIPLDLPPGSVPISLDLYTISGKASAQSGVTIAIGKSPLPLLSVQPSSLTFADSGSKPPAQTISVSSSGAPIAFTLFASADSTSNWLSVSATSGTTPASIVVTANPPGLAPGSYPGSLSFFYPAGSLYVNVQLTINSPAPPVKSIITTVAGADFTFPYGPLPAVNAPTGPISGVARDPSGNLYASDSGNHMVLKVDTSGTLSVFAGNGIPGFSGDGGSATSASLNTPGHLAVDNNGNLFIADSGVIRQVSASGTITTVAGLALAAGTVPSIDVDSAGNLYTTSTLGIQKRSSLGVVSTIAGSANLFPNAIAVDAAGDVYATSGTAPVAQYQDGLLYELTTSGSLITLARSLYYPMGLRVDPAGNVYIAEYYQNQPNSNRIVKVTSGVVTTVAGNGLIPFAGDNKPALQTSIGPTDLALGAGGSLLIADNFNCRVRLFSNGVITTVAGNGQYRFGGDSGLAKNAFLRAPTGVAVDASGNLYVADSGNHRVRAIAPNGTINTIAGNGVADFRGDGGSAAAASLNSPNGVAIDSAGNLYIADTGNNRVRQITAGGAISTIAGNGSSVFTAGFGYQLSSGYTDPMFSGDGGLAIAAPLSFPTAVAVDSSANILIAELFRIRKVTRDGNISTSAGSGPGSCPPNPFLAYCGSLAGDGGPATSAKLNSPNGFAVDGQGNIVIADSGNGVIREVANSGVINTIIQTQVAVFDPHTPSIIRDFPTGVTLDQAGNVYYSDVFDQSQNLLGNPNRDAAKVATITASGSLLTLAGGGLQGFAGDGGIATSAALNNPTGLAIDTAGNLYIADTFNNRIREVLAAPPSFPDPTATTGPIMLSSSAGGVPVSANLSILVVKQMGSSIQVPGMNFTAAVTAGSDWLTISQTSGNTPGLITIKANPFSLKVNPPATSASFTGSITVSIPNANPATRVIPVTLQVGTALAPKLQIDNSSLQYVYSTTSAPRSQNINVSNQGGGSMPFTLSVSYDNPRIAPWLRVIPASGTAIPATPVRVSVQATPTNLPAGTYSARILVLAGSAGSITVPVSMTISINPLILLLSKPELVFTAVQNGGVIPSQAFGVLNIGSGPLNWTIPPPTTLRGGNWLSAASVTPASGTTTANNPGSAPLVTVTVNPAGLPSGVYYGLIKVLSAGPPPAVNTPQYVVVVLEVLPPSAPVVPIVQPASLVFTGPAGQESPGSQNLQIYDTSGTLKTFLASVSTDDGGNWIAILPSDGTIARTQPSTLVVQPLTGNLASGKHTANIVLHFSDGNTKRIPITFVVNGTASTTTPGLTGASGTRHAVPDTTGCTPATLTPYLTSLGENFNVKAGYVHGLDALVVDNCGNPLSDPQASVGVSFNNGDTPQNLVLVTPGVWHGYWDAKKPKNSMTITVGAQSGTLIGQADFVGDLGSGQGNPVISQNGVVSAANYADSDTAPGALISIFGANLASGTLPAPQLPLTTDLGDSTITLKDFVLPLYLVSPGQLNAVVPYAMPLGPDQHLFVQNSDTSYSAPVHVNIVTAQPGMFLWDPLKDGNLADFYGTLTDQQGNLIQPSHPAHRGDIVTIYAAGLGAVNPPVSDGVAITSTARTLNPVTVSFGGVTADSNDPIFYAGVAVGPGVYQINVRIPPTAPLGGRITVTITVDDPNNMPITSTSALTSIQ